MQPRFLGCFVIQYLDMVFSFPHQRIGLSRVVLLLIIGINCLISMQSAVFAAGCDTMTCGPGTYCLNETCVPNDAGETEGGPLGVKNNRNLILLEPLNGQPTSLSPSPGIGIFFEYFNLSWPWVLGVAAGVGVLQALIGAIQVMLSGNDSGMREGGKSKMTWALAGLLMVGLAGFILRSINPIFFT